MNRCFSCGKEFKKETINQKFCNYQCRYEWYSNQNVKEKRKRESRRYYEKKSLLTFPLWICPSCRYEIRLNFYPLKEPEKFIELTCSKCGYTNKDRP